MHLVGRIFLAVDFHLVYHGVVQVDVHLVCQANQVYQHIREFMPDLFPLGFGQLVPCARMKPLKVLQQLGGLDGQRCRQVLGRVELIPVASATNSRMWSRSTSRSELFSGGIYGIPRIRIIAVCDKVPWLPTQLLPRAELAALRGVCCRCR